MTSSASKVSVNTMKCIPLFVLIVDIAFTENWLPVRRTIGVWPFSPQVRSVTWSERMPT
jgi:hypothetical protein